MSVTAYQSGFLGYISTTPDVGWNASLMSWKYIGKTRMYDVTRQNRSDLVTLTPFVARVSGPSDYRAACQLLLRDVADAAFLGFGQAILVYMYRKPGGTQRYAFTGVVGDMEIDAPLDGPIVARGIVTSVGSSIPISA